VPPIEEQIRPRSTMTELDPDLRSPAWSGHKSELPADESTLASPTPTRQEFKRVEAEGSPRRGDSARYIGQGSYQVPGQQGRVYEMPG